MSETQAIDWESRYRDKTAGWERHGINPAFLAWRDSGALAPCRILIPGGGRSLKLRAQVEQADLFAWDPVSPFDAVYDQTCLCALPPGLWPSYARRLHRWL